jgi:hypothetical protein
LGFGASVVACVGGAVGACVGGALGDSAETLAACVGVALRGPLGGSVGATRLGERLAAGGSEPIKSLESPSPTAPSVATAAEAAAHRQLLFGRSPESCAVLTEGTEIGSGAGIIRVDIHAAPSSASSCAHSMCALSTE